MVAFFNLKSGTLDEKILEMAKRYLFEQKLLLIIFGLNGFHKKDSLKMTDTVEIIPQNTRDLPTG